MKKAWLALALGASLCWPVAAQTADNTMVGVGTGAVAGAVVGGPVGALVGAVAGGFIGSNTQSARTRSGRRARAADRRRHVGRATPVRYVARAGAPAQEAVRPAAERQPARVPASEVSTGSDGTTGSTGRGWSDPR